MFGVLALGVIIYVATDKGRIKIVVDGHARIVSIDGERSIEPGDMDRRAAESVLSLGGIVFIRGAEDEEEIKPGDGLPAATFKLIRVKLANKPDLVDTDLEPLRGLTNVIEVDLFGEKNHGRRFGAFASFDKNVPTQSRSRN